MGIREKLHDGERLRSALTLGGRLHNGERIRTAIARARVESKFPSPPHMKPLSRFHDGARVKATLGKAARGGALVIGGTAQYVTKMAKHLRQEHPSTRTRMKVTKFYGKVCGTKRKHPCARYGTARCPYCKRSFRLGR